MRRAKPTTSGRRSCPAAVPSYSPSRRRSGGLETAQVAVRDLRTGTQKVLLRGGSHGHYVASGHLVYVAAGTLRAIAFDLTSAGDTRHVGAGTFNGSPQRNRARPISPSPPTGRSCTWTHRVVSRRTRARSSGSIGAARRSPSLRSRAPTCSRASRPTAPASRSTALDQKEDLWIWDIGRATAQAPDARPRHGLESGVDTGQPADRLQLESRRPVQPLVAGGRRHWRRRAADHRPQCPVCQRDYTGRERGPVPRSDADDGRRICCNSRSTGHTR